MMGGSSYSDDLYATRATARAAAGTPFFAHTDDIDKGVAAAGVHAKLNPRNVTRESRDSDAHPESLAIAVFFDETGSMKSLPGRIQKKLPALMALLISKGYVAHPQVLFGAIGDANSDSAPLQVGQFESGLEMEDDLSLVYLEGNGGGGRPRESYELAHYFCAKHTLMDCFEKRGAKGYLFTIGDEAPYDTIRSEQVERLIGDKLPQNISTAEVVKMAQERFHVFHIHAQQGSYPNNGEILGQWRTLLGENVLLLEDSDNIAELIATTIGVNEGTDLADVRAHLSDVGTDAAAIDHITKSLVPLSKSVGMAKAGTVGGAMPPVAEPVGAGVERL